MKKAVLIIIAICLVTMSSYSQEDVLRPKGRTDGGYSKSDNHPWAVGLEAGGTFNVFTSDLSLTDLSGGQASQINSIYSVFESVTGVTPHFGAFVDYSINDMFGIHLKLIYNSVRYSGSETNFFEFYDVNSGDYLGTDPVTFNYKQEYSFINIEPMFRINPTSELFILVGPSIRLTASDIETNNNYTKNDDTGITFANNGYEIDEYMTHKGSNNYALNFGLGYKFNVDKNIAVAPQLLYSLSVSEMENLDETSVFDPAFYNRIVSARTLNQIRFSLTLWFENL